MDARAGSQQGAQARRPRGPGLSPLPASGGLLCAPLCRGRVPRRWFCVRSGSHVQAIPASRSAAAPPPLPSRSPGSAHVRGAPRADDPPPSPLPASAAYNSGSPGGLLCADSGGPGSRPLGGSPLRRRGQRPLRGLFCADSAGTGTARSRASGSRQGPWGGAGARAGCPGCWTRWQRGCGRCVQPTRTVLRFCSQFPYSFPHPRRPVWRFAEVRGALPFATPAAACAGARGRLARSPRRSGRSGPRDPGPLVTLSASPALAAHAVFLWTGRAAGLLRGPAPSAPSPKPSA